MCIFKSYANAVIILLQFIDLCLVGRRHHYREIGKIWLVPLVSSLVRVPTLVCINNLHLSSYGLQTDSKKLHRSQKSPILKCSVLCWMCFLFLLILLRTAQRTGMKSISSSPVFGHSVLLVSKTRYVNKSEQSTFVNWQMFE